jgi:hypothetical protein
VIRVFDEPGNVMETHQHEGDFKASGVSCPISSDFIGQCCSHANVGNRKSTARLFCNS